MNGEDIGFVSNLCRSCAGNYSCHEFDSATAIECLEDSIPQHSTPSSGSCIIFLAFFLPPLPQCSLHLGKGDVNVTLMVEHSAAALISNAPLELPSLTKADSYINT